MSLQEPNCVFKNITGTMYDRKQIMSNGSNNQNSSELASGKLSTINVHTTATDLNAKIIENYFNVLRKRNDWTSIPADRNCLTLLQLPINKIYISETSSENCHTLSHCKAELLNILERDKFIFDDIQYNFIIAGDGTIFEGLSWKCKVLHKWTDNNSIWVSLTCLLYTSSLKCSKKPVIWIQLNQNLGYSKL